jgi:hypothetical protein
MKSSINTSSKKERITEGLTTSTTESKGLDKFSFDMNKNSNSDKNQSTTQSTSAISSALGMSDNKKNMKDFSRSIADLIVRLKTNVLLIKDNILQILADRISYDPAEFIARKFAGVMVGRNKTSSDSIKAYFDSVGTEIDHVFTQAHLDAINDESEIMAPDEQMIHDIIYDYLLMPIMMWAIYNWYYKLFFPMAKCPEKKDYSYLCEMIFPGIITGCIVLPYYEMNYGMFYANSFFHEDFKFNYGYILFMGCFIAVYFLWVNAQTRIDFSYSKFGNYLSIWNGVNVLILMFSYYLVKYPVNSIIGGIFFIIIFTITLGIVNQLKELVYILVMFYFIYYSFFVLPIENESWDIVGLMQKINQANIKEMYLDDAWYTRIFKHINNFIFTSPIMLIFVIVTLSEMGTVSNANLPDPSWIKTSMYMFLSTVFIMSAFYSVFQYVMFITSSEQKKTFNIMENIYGKNNAKGVYDSLIQPIGNNLPSIESLIPSYETSKTYLSIFGPILIIICIYWLPLFVSFNTI